MAIEVQDLVKDGEHPRTFLTKTRTHQVKDPNDVTREFHTRNY